MSEVVDSIIADLDVRYAKYVAGFDKATAAHDRFTKSVPKIGAMGGFTQAEAQGYADRHTKIGKAAEDSGEKRKRAAKGASDVEKAEAKAAADAVKKAAKDASDAQRVAARAAEAEVKASARARVQTEKQAAREIEQAQRRYYAQGPKVFEAKAREFSAVDRQKDIIAAKASAAALAQAEREKQSAAKATAEKEAEAARAVLARAEAEKVAAAAIAAAAEKEAAAKVRLAAVAQRAVDRRTGQIAPAVNSSIGATVPRGTSGQRGIPAAALAAPDVAGEVAAEKEVNHLLADQAVLSSRLGVLKGAERDIIRDQIAELRLVRQLETAGLDDAAIALKLDERRAVVARERSLAERKRSDASVTNFASGAGIGRGTGNAAAVAGIATAVGVGVGIEVIQSAIDYGKALDDLSKQLGITVEDLQAYQKLARDSGVETTTLSSAFGQFASNLGRAQQGQEEFSKVFKALGVDIKSFSSAGDALPTVIDRISQLEDPLQRAAIETRLFGEEGRKLDPLLSGGAARVSQLARSLQETGKALSQKEIQELDQTAQKLGEVKNQLQVDFARIVSGNADAIIGLANSFGTLAGSVIGAIGSIQQFNAQKLNDLTGGNGGAGDKPLAPGFVARLQTRAEGIVRRAVGAAGGQVQSTTRRVETSTPAELAFLTGLSRPTAPVQAGNVNQNLIRTLGAPKPPKGPKGKSAESIAREEEQRTKQFNDQVAQANGDYLRAQQQLAATAGQRADIELQILETAYKARLADIDSNASRNKLAGADAAIEDTRAAELKAAERKAYLADQSVTLQQRDFDIQRDLTSGAQTLLDIQAGLISSQLVIATTAKERRRLSLELLENEKKQEYGRLAGVIGSSVPGSAESLEAEQRLSGLDAKYDGQRQNVLQSTASPLEAYRKSLHDATDDTNEALEGVAVNALGRLEDTVASSIGKVLGLKGAFGDLFGSILTDIAKIELKKGILALLNGGGEGGSGGGLAGIAASVGRAFGLGGTRAGGGNVVGGSNYLVGERGPEIVSFGSSGKVYPNGALPSIGSTGGGGNVVHQSFTLDNRYGITTPELIDEMNAIARREGTKAGGASFIAGQRSAPGTLAQYDKLQG